MKKKFRVLLSALSVLLCSSVKADVTLYGVVDVGLEVLSNTPLAGSSNTAHLVRLQSNNAQASRFGMKGSEDLGSGLKSVFKLESIISPDTGSLAPSGKLFHGSSYVGLANANHQLTLGRQTSPLYDMSFFYDPVAIFAYSINTVDFSGFAGRADNAVKYTYNSGPWTASALYSFGYSGAQEETPGSPKIAREVSGSVAYTSSTYALIAAVDAVNGVTLQTQDQRTSRFVLAGTAQLDSVNKLFLGYERFNKSSIPSSAGAAFDLLWAGMRHAFTPALFSGVGLYYENYRNSRNGAVSVSGYLDYFLSKRTDLYLNVGAVKNEGTLNLGIDGSAGLIGPGTTAGGRQLGTVIGIRHTF